MTSHTETSESERSVIPAVFPAGTLSLDRNGCVTDLNDLAAELLGSGRTAILGKALAEVVGEHAAPRVEDHFLKTAAEGRLARCELVLTDDAGIARYILLQTLADRSGDSALAYRTTIVDTTSYVERILEADEARLSAERVARSKTDFLARLSHEIRSALASMIGFADLLKESVPDADRELTEIIRDSGRHLLDTLNSVMDLARLEFETGDVELSEVDVVQRVRPRIAMFRKLAAARGLDLSFRAESESAVARLNVTFLDRAVHNLVDNAIKYTPSGKVEVSVEQREGRVWIYVSDTGIGIRQEFLPRLFSPFERDKRKGEAVEGVGLGLAITKYLVELMDGRIVACSTLGSGSTFTVDFPLVDDASEVRSSVQK